MPSEIGETIPCSAVVVGKGLGKVQAPKTKCPTCNLDGDRRVDCPVAWANVGKPLPGLSSRGGRLKGAFTDGNPTKDIFAQWVVFLQDRRNFPQGARPMPKPGAPELKDFKKAARDGAPP